LTEAVQQLQEDMQQVLDRLGVPQVDEITLAVEEDLVASLEELVEAIREAREQLEERKRKQQDPQQQQQQPSSSGEPPEEPLVEQIAELRMIRSLQLRVNRRTIMYARMVEGDVGQTRDPQVLNALRELAERENRVFRATRDIVQGKNE
jgi:hypothetical protein